MSRSPTLLHYQDNKDGGGAETDATVLGWLHRGFARCAAVLAGGATLWIFAIMVMICADVIGLKVFSRPLYGVVELTAASIVAVVFAQLPYTLFEVRFTPGGTASTRSGSAYSGSSMTADGGSASRPKASSISRLNDRTALSDSSASSARRASRWSRAAMVKWPEAVARTERSVTYTTGSDQAPWPQSDSIQVWRWSKHGGVTRSSPTSSPAR